MKPKQITKTMLLSVIKQLKEWYAIRVPIDLLVKLCDEFSYDDIRYFDTIARERMADAIAYEVTNQSWPCGSRSSKRSTEFFNKFKQNAKKHGIEVGW